MLEKIPDFLRGDRLVDEWNNGVEFVAYDIEIVCFVGVIGG